MATITVLATDKRCYKS